ncbi:MAG: cytochrome c maturation protein CcmE [Candidatus Tectomicrobia bacterium]|nr:cytochrome c maturation protein CcmE [Candidatus Tectomicrobia bacterium]
MKKNNLRFLVGGVIILGAIAYLVYTGARDTMMYYLTVAEVHAKGESLIGQGVRIAGKVQPNSIKRDTQGFGVNFLMVDVPAKTNDTESGLVAVRQASLLRDGAPKTLPVHFAGIVPDMFKDNADVIVEGQVRSDGSFHAKTLMTQCPSKYESDPKALAGKPAEAGDAATKDRPSQRVPAAVSTGNGSPS